MKRVFMAAFSVMLGISTLTFAEVKVQNKDDKAHDLSIKCSSGSTTKRSIQSGTISGVGTGPCEISVDGGGSIKVADGDTYVIGK